MDSIGMTPNLIGAGIENVKGPAEIDPTAERIEALGKEFEGVFMSLMLKEMRNSLEDGGFFGGEGSDTYGGMFDMFMGQSLAESSPLKIADLVSKSYSKFQSNASHPDTTRSQSENQAGGEGQGKPSISTVI